MKKSKTSPISDQEVDALLIRFVQEDMTLAEAEEAIECLHTARYRAVSRVLDLLRGSAERDPAGTGDASLLPVDHDALLILLGCLGDASMVEGVVGLIEEPALGDDLKLKLISLVHQFAPNMDVADLMHRLQDPRGAMYSSQRQHLDRLKTPRELAPWLELMETQMSPAMRAAFVQSTIELGDAAAVPLLTCICYDPDDDVALAAMDGVERLKDARALPALEELAARHPTGAVRTAARKTADRLRVRASLVPQAQPVELAPLHGCYLTTVDGSGGQAVLVCRQLADGQVEVVNVMFNDQEGIKQCFGTEIDLEELEGLLDAMSEQGISPVRVTHGQCAYVLDLACDVTWQTGRPLPMAYVAWRRAIDGDAERTDPAWPPLAVPPEKRDALLSECHYLLLQDEFAYWFYNPDEIGDLDRRYLDLAAGDGLTTNSARLRQFLRHGVRELVTSRKCELIEGRLRRVAPLLRELYVEDEVWQWAIVAADALAGHGPLPLDEHPLLLGIVACSVENALGESIDWVEALASAGGNG